MRGGNINLWSYVNGFFASLGGCTLPVLSVLAAKVSDPSFNKWRFLLSFFLAQFVLFSLFNLSVASIYSLFQEIQPFLLLLAALLTFTLAAGIYMGKPINVPSLGGLYGIALSPCSIGFVVATAASSFTYFDAVLNALLFSLGIVTPLTVIALLLRSTSSLMKHAALLERLSVLLLVVTSFYLAYLAGSSWRWIP